MIQINDLRPDGLRFEDLTPPQVAALLEATADIVPREGPEAPVPAEQPDSAVRTQGRVMWGPSFVWFSRVSVDEINRIGAAFQRLQAAPGNAVLP